jgi:2-succinyl-5-enolpyruvyl-6-hydroxy-3-cyclohexene-1-carboxylate synthase
VPDLVIRVGNMPTSKPLRAWLATARQVVLDPDLSWNEPTRSAQRLVAGSATATLASLTGALGPRDPAEPWLDEWLSADAVAADELAGIPEPSEARAYASLGEWLPDGATVWVSSSMPVREVESFFPSVAADVRFLSNRGANGIDGVVSSAVGAAIASPDPVFLLTGELALLHDLGGLVARARLDIPLRVLCVNNGGGGIFDFLPVAGSGDAAAYERLIATPHPVSLETVAELASLPHRRVSDAKEIQAALASPCLAELRTDRAESVSHHRELFSRVAARLAE